MSCEVVVTRGGVPAVRDRLTGEVMHPVGPLREAAELYVAPSRLAARLADGPVVVHDVGLGAGSNAAAAWRLSETRPTGPRLTIVSFDRTTEALALALVPDHAGAFGLTGDTGDAARSLLDCGQVDGSLTCWRLITGELPATLADAPAADVIFWDPFSPRANPELWSVAAFTLARAACGPRATLHTYSASTATRAAMLLAGFAVGAGVATGSKRETTMAAVDPADLPQPLGARWLARLQRSNATLPPGAVDQIRTLPQFA